jgi:predicted kinase
MVGVSGSGKTTMGKKIAAYLNAVHVETDAIREELTGDPTDQSKNAEVFKVAHQRVDQALKAGRNVVADSTSVDAFSRKGYLQAGKRNGADMRAYVMNTPVDMAKVYNMTRTRNVPDFVIDKQNAKFSMPSTAEGFDEVVKVGQNDDVSKFVKLNA